jgi:hypothetical protein
LLSTILGGIHYGNHRGCLFACQKKTPHGAPCGVFGVLILLQFIVQMRLTLIDVNGQLAGNCRTSRKMNLDRKQRIDRPTAR